MLSLPLMNSVGMFLEESEHKDYQGILSFVVLSYIVVPFQAYAAVKGFIEHSEGPWFRTPKTGKITDIFTRGKFFRWIGGILPGRVSSVAVLAPQKAVVSMSHFSSNKRQLRLLSRIVVVSTLILSILLNYTIRFVELETALASESVVTVANHEQIKESNQEENVPVPITQATAYAFPTSKGNLEYIFYQEPRVQIKLGQSELEMIIIGSNLGPAQHNGALKNRQQVSYQDVLPDINAEFSINQGELREGLILNQTQRLEAIDYLIRMGGVVPREAHGSIQFVDERTDETIFTLAPPYMYEKNSNLSHLLSIEGLMQSDVNYSLGLEYRLHRTPLGWQLTKYLTESGKKWLADPNRQFPVVIDPSVIVSGTIIDADVQFGGLQRKVAFVNGNWYAFHNDDGKPQYKKSTDGVSWGSNVNVDATENDTDNYNSSIWVKGNVIWVTWIDDDSEDIEFRSIDTASGDALGTKCTSNLGAITIDSTNMVSIAVQNTGTDIYVTQSDTEATPDTEVHLLQSTSACAFTDRTSGSGLTAGDRPVLVYDGDSNQRDDVIVVFQDGNLSYSQWSAVTSVWVTSNITLDATNTDTTYSAVSDGSTTWVLSQTSSTDTKFYRLGQFENNVDTNIGGNRAMVDIDCPASGDCKILYFDPPSNTIKFVDCDNTACTSATTTDIDTTAQRGTAYNIAVALDCPSSTDCKVVWHDHVSDNLYLRDCSNSSCSTSDSTIQLDGSVGRQGVWSADIFCISGSECDTVYIDTDLNDLKFVNCTAGTGGVCDTATGGTVTNSILDAEVGRMGGVSSIYCPSSTDCKVVYYDAITNGSILFADCNAAACSSATLDATSTIDSNVGIGDTRFVAVDCAAGATECRVAYYDGTDQDITFVDCAADADCSPANCDTPTNCVDIDTDVGQAGSPVGLDCNNNAGSPDDCKIIFFDASDQDITFVDCSNDTCSSSTISDIDTDAGADTAYLSLDCSLGVSDCQVVYLDGAEKDMVEVDCEDGDCSAPTSSTDIDTTIEADQPWFATDCPSPTNCKVVYHDISEADITFADCNDATCSAPTINDIDANVSRLGAPISINCPTSDDCKVVYHDVLAITMNFVDCNDESCSSPPSPTVIDSNVGMKNSSARSAIDCPAATNCKVIWHRPGVGDLWFADCNDAACSTSTQVKLDENSGFVLDSMDLDCSPGSANCKVVWFDETDDDITFIDCSVEACCVNTLCTGVGETAIVQDLDDVGTLAIDSQASVDCVGTDDDCKVIFHDEADQDITFIDCSVAQCCSVSLCGSGETATITDIDASIGNADHQVVGTALDCVTSGLDNCKIVYWDNTDKTFYFVDCDNAACSSSTIVPLSTTSGTAGTDVEMDCGTDATDCKIVYHDYSDSTRIVFVDCLDEACVYDGLTAPYTGGTNVLSVSLSYDSTNDDLYAHIIKDSTEQAYFKSTDASGISWSAQTSYGFTAGDLNNISAPMTGAGITQIGVVLRQGSNYEFSAVPENWWTLMGGGIVMMMWVKRRRSKFQKPFKIAKSTPLI